MKTLIALTFGIALSILLTSCAETPKSTTTTTTTRTSASQSLGSGNPGPSFGSQGSSTQNVNR